jgi:rhodanese-related sulfurtransferase
MSATSGGTYPDNDEEERMSDQAVPEIDPAAAAAAVSAGAVLVDVREPDEWAAGHAADAVHIPLGELSERASELPDGSDFIFVCRAGGRSLAAATAFRAAGYAAANLTGGMQAWAAAGLDVVATDGPGIVI